MRASVCIATYDKPDTLSLVLESIFRQRPPFETEVIVVDDGSPSDQTQKVCEGPPVIYRRIDRAPGYRNPSVARNEAYRTAKGEILICQSDDVEHDGDAVEGLVDAIQRGTFVLGTVTNVDRHRRPVAYSHLVEFTSPRVRRPLLFLGAVLRSDMYRVGGCEERFVEPGRDDVYLAECLMQTAKLTPVFTDAARGWHHDHRRPADLPSRWRRSRRVYEQLVEEGRWVSSGGPWPYS